MEILIFDKSRVNHCELDDGYGGNVGLENHLRYLREECGTPDGDCDNLDNFDDAEHFFGTYSETDCIFVEDYSYDELLPEDIYDYFEDRE